MSESAADLLARMGGADPAVSPPPSDPAPTESLKQRFVKMFVGKAGKKNLLGLLALLVLSLVLGFVFSWLWFPVVWLVGLAVLIRRGLRAPRDNRRSMAALVVAALVGSMFTVMAVYWTGNDLGQQAQAPADPAFSKEAINKFCKNAGKTDPTSCALNMVRSVDDAQSFPVLVETICFNLKTEFPAQSAAFDKECGSPNGTLYKKAVAKQDTIIREQCDNFKAFMGGETCPYDKPKK